MPGQRSFDFDDIFRRPGPLTVAYGMGTDSTALLVELVRRKLRPDLITFADTGGEHPRTNAYLPVINAWLADQDFPTVTVVRYVPQRFKHRPYTTLAGNCLANSTLPSLAYGRKSCSLKWKASPQEKYITRYWPPGVRAVTDGVPIRRLIGYDAGGKDQLRGAVNPDPRFRYAYPLQTWGFDREDCIRIIRAAGLPLSGKSACTFCPSCKPHELLALARQHPELAARAVAMEDRARPTFRTIDGLWRNGTETRPGSWRTFLAEHGQLIEF